MAFTTKPHSGHQHRKFVLNIARWEPLVALGECPGEESVT